MRAETEKVAIAADDAIGFSRDRALQNPVVVRIFGDCMQDKIGRGDDGRILNFDANRNHVRSLYSELDAEFFCELIEKRC